MDLVTQRRIAQAGKEVDPGWYRIHRRLSFHVTRGALALGMKADQASYAMMLFGLLGAVLLVPAHPVANAIGFAVLYFAFLLDKVDGELARLQGTQNARGIFLDRMHHRLVEPCLFLAVALHQYRIFGGLVPLALGFAVIVLANAIEENQHLAPYVLYKRMREGATPPAGPPSRSRGWTQAAALFRPLKGFRMFLTALFLFAVTYAIGGQAPTYALGAAAVGLLVYLAFQCLDALHGGVDAEMSAIASLLRRRLVLAVVCGALFAGSARAAGTYYVDGANPSCSNSGPGTQGTPYCTISAAVAAHSGAGTTIRVAPGTYREQVTVPASGASGSPFVIEGTGTFAQPVVIDGSAAFNSPAQWTLFQGTTWRALGVTWIPLMVLVDGQRLVPYTGSPQTLPSGSFRGGQDTLFVNLGVAGDAGNPGTHETYVGKIQHGVFVSGKSWVTIRGLSIQQTNNRGIFVLNSSHVTVEDNTVSRVQRFGIQAENSTDVTIADNRVTASGDHGISLANGTTGSVVEENESDHNARPGVRAANGIHLFAAPKNVLRRNRTHDNQDTGLHIQSGSDSTLCVQNLSYANGDHGFDHLLVTGTTHVGGVAYGNYKDGYSFEGQAVGQRMHDCIAVANGETTGRYDLYVDSTSAIGHVSNDNLFWNPSGQPPVDFDKVVYASVAAYAAATGQDTRTIEADPRFVAPQVGDFHLLSGSPAIDAANTGVAGWPGEDFEGFARIDDQGTPNTGTGPITYADRGAFEFGSSGIVGVPEPAPSPAVELEGVSPNPLPGRGRLAFRIARPGPVTVDLHDARGRRVRTLVAEAMAPAGWFVTPLDLGGSLPAGLYLYRVRTADGERAGKFVVVR